MGHILIITLLSLLLIPSLLTKLFCVETEEEAHGNGRFFGGGQRSAKSNEHSQHSQHDYGENEQDRDVEPKLCQR